MAEDRRKKNPASVDELPTLSVTDAKVTFSDVHQPPPEQDGWEMLSVDDGPVLEPAVVVQADKNVLQHSISTPDLHRLTLESVAELQEEDNADSSFSMVSGPASVISLSSNPWSGISFRDAILSSPPGGSEAEPLSSKESKQSEIRPRRQPRIKPKFVVKPIKRCAKSTGDLQSFAKKYDDESDDALGACDAMDYYHRKDKGQQGRQNGLKLRPDEAKRKQIIVNKKDMQRRAQRSVK